MLAFERTTELPSWAATRCPNRDVQDVQEIPQNGRHMHTVTAFRVDAWVGIARGTKEFPFFAPPEGRPPGL